MKRNRTYTPTILILYVLVAVLLAGCSGQVAATPIEGDTTYSGILNTSYENALDVTSQLALGTLNLEGTADAVAVEQAAKLLPLWQAVAGNELHGDAERNAVARQIEATMTGDQISAIAAMRLTQQDAQTWIQNQAPAAGVSAPAAGQAPAGDKVPNSVPQDMSEEQLTQMREQFQNMSPEEHASLRAQFGQSDSSGGGLSQGMIGAVVDLLAERSGATVAQAGEPAAATTVAVELTGTAEPAAEPTPQATSTAAVEPTSTPEPAPEPTPTVVAEPTSAPDASPEPTPEPVSYVVQAGNTLAAIAQAYGITVQAIVEANGIQDPNIIHIGQALVIPGPAQIPEGPIAGSSPGSQTPTTSISVPALEQLPDTDPGPPLTIVVSANTATQDPLVKESQTYKVTGIVRNDGDQTYALSALHVTFFDAEGFRGTFQKHPQPWETGGEWIWHGTTEADVASLLLAPGEEWPFSVEITAQDMASFLIHPDASATERQSLPVELSDVKVTTDSTGYLRIAGTATNVNDVAVKNVTVSAVLLDANGQIVSLGSTYVLQEDIEPGASVSFDLRVTKEPYVSYQLYAQAERDWE